MSGPLAGLKILDLSRVLAGPWATQVLADYGAEVWKIENPKGGDDTRKWGETYSGQMREEDVAEDYGSNNGSNSALDKDQYGDITAYYLSANRGKHSITIDIKTDKGQKLLQELTKQADIFVENFKVGNLAKYQLDYQSLKKLNPQLIYCSITGFGQTGPYAKHAGYDVMIQASAGLMSLTGEKKGAPQKTGVAISDLMTGMYAVSAILAAVIHRNKSGEGQYIDLALFDTQVGWLANQGMSYLLTGETPTRQGSTHPSIVPYQPVNCADGSIILAVGNDRQFRDCCTQLGVTELANDERFDTNNHRIVHHDLLIKLMEEKFKTNSCCFWMDKLSEVQVPCGPINDIKQVFEHPQIKARDTKISVEHPTMGRVNQVANPVKFSETPIEYNKAAPSLGEDTHAILEARLNFNSDEIKELRRLGVI
ncbi:MAG: CoA transferase [Kangiellaceae bacterium]|nr:CoA transferase [Kangiellaceae bacterium]